MAARTRLLAALAVALLLVFTGCSRTSTSDDNAASADTTAAAPDTTAAPPDTTAATDTTATTDDPSSTSSDDDGDTTDSTDAFGHTDADNAAFRDAYAAAFDAECRRIWSTYAGADGLMADPDFPDDTYSVQDCLDELDTDYGEFTDSVDEARSTGLDDAQIAASDLADPLCATAGTPCWSYGDS
jgi:hypothetical protein